MSLRVNRIVKVIITLTVTVMDQLDQAQLEHLRQAMPQLLQQQQL
jgi:hypothetical protein